MDIDELKRILLEEDFEQPVLYGVGERQSEGAVLERGDTGWTVYVSDERGGALGKTLRTFDDEPQALEFVLQKARQGTRYHRALRTPSV